MKTLPISGRLGICLALMCLAVSPLVAATHRSNLEKTFQVAPGEKLRMQVDRGAIQLVTSARSKVVIHVTRELAGSSEAKAKEVFADHEVIFAQKAGVVSVDAKYKTPHEGGWGRNPFHQLQVSYRVELPRQFSLDLKTAGGSISCQDIEGMVQARTSGGTLEFQSVNGTLDLVTAGGSIKVAGATGPAKLKTSGGSIKLGFMQADTLAETAGGSIAVEKSAARLQVRASGGGISLGEVQGPTEARTDGGSIRVDSSLASLLAHTSGGGISVEDAQAEVDLQTSAGSVAVGFSAQPDRDCRLRTSGGSVSLRMPEKLAFDVDARTSAGSINTEIPVQATVVGKQDSDVLQGKMNGGGVRLEIRTSAGSITIKKR